MNITELIEQLQLIIHDHPEAAHFEVRTGELEDIFAVNLKHEEGSFRGEDYVEDFVEIESYRPHAFSER